MKKRKVGTAALTEENGNNEEEDAEGDEEDAKEDEKGEEEESNAEAEEPADAAVSAKKKTNGAAAPKKADVETVDLDDEDE